MALLADFDISSFNFFSVSWNKSKFLNISKLYCKKRSIDIFNKSVALILEIQISLASLENLICKVSSMRKIFWWLGRLILYSRIIKLQYRWHTPSLCCVMRQDLFESNRWQLIIIKILKLLLFQYALVSKKFLHTSAWNQTALSSERFFNWNTILT